MNIKCCDICYTQNNEKKIEKATKRISVSNSYKRLALDVCDKHQNWIKDQPPTKTIDDIERDFFQLRYNKENPQLTED